MKILFIGSGCIVLLIIGFIVLLLIVCAVYLYRLGVRTEKEDRYHENTSTDSVINQN